MPSCIKPVEKEKLSDRLPLTGPPPVDEDMPSCIKPMEEEKLSDRLPLTGPASPPVDEDMPSCIKPIEEEKLSDRLPLTGPPPVEFVRQVDEDMNDTWKRKHKRDDKDIKVYQKRKKQSKAVDDEDIDVQSKEITIFAPSNLRVSKVLVREGMELEKFQPMYIRDRVIKPTCKPTVRFTAVQTILYVNRSSRIGIFSMEDLLVDHDADAENCPMVELDGVEEIQKRCANFKKFDIVEDHSHHFYSAKNSELNEPSEQWVNKIREEWTVLEEQLPETIYVRVYQSRPDLLRAVIVGQEGTPYNDGLFFFDVCFPSNYPNSPPLVHYHSYGLGINPNLHKSGEVLLTLPITNGGQEQMWVAGTCTMLHLLESIQNRLLNREPLYNEVTYAITRCSDFGKQSSLIYNDNIFIKSLKTMACIMNKPPKDFEDFVAGHFHNRFHNILMASTKKTPSITFKKDLALCRKLLAAAFKKIGAK